MLYFTQRLKIAQEYEKYIKDNGLKDCPENVVAFLLGKNLLNEEKCKEYIKNVDKEN